MEANRLQEQIEYYRARAPEYDDWFLRLGRYNRGTEQNAAWFREVEEVRGALKAFGATGDVLELAGGTGLWTEFLAESAQSLTVVDASTETLEINRARVKRPDVEYVETNILEWQPEHRYDAVFFGFWLSHVPPDLFARFWKTVQSALKPNGRVFLVDSLFDRSSTAADHILNDKSDLIVTRKLNDGREFQIFKVFYDANDLKEKLGDLGWDCEIEETEHYFVYASCRFRRL